MIQPPKKHFHTFDALRFFAFLKVFLLHVPIIAFPFFSYLKNGGGIGVIFFFVLSGFLITYLLLTEKQSAGTIDLRYFFFRRILRIWPLYYLMAGFAFLTPWILSFIHLAHSNEGYQPNWLFSLTFLENYKMILTRDHPNVSPLGVTWSLCIEEHFYIVWGLLLFYLKIEKIPVLILACFFIAAISRILFIQHNLPTIDLFTNIDYFAWGAIPAYLFVCAKKPFDQKLSVIPVRIKLAATGVILLNILISSNISYPLQPYVEPLTF
jgi:peptidoglycan/LPS O-acetylase OafA/YrhL